MDFSALVPYRTALHLLFAATLALLSAHSGACSIGYPPGSSGPPPKKHVFTAVVEGLSTINVEVQGFGFVRRADVVALLLRVQSASTEEPAVGAVLAVVKREQDSACNRYGSPFDTSRYYVGRIVRVEANELPYVDFYN